MPESQRPTPAPAQVDAVRVVGVGTAGWFVAFCILLVVRHGEWLWTSLAGWVLGLIGLPLIVAQRRAAARRGTGNSDRSRELGQFNDPPR